jgi:hypothetical protein
MSARMEEQPSDAKRSEVSRPIPLWNERGMMSGRILRKNLIQTVTILTNQHR